MRYWRCLRSPTKRFWNRHPCWFVVFRAPAWPARAKGHLEALPLAVEGSCELLRLILQFPESLLLLICLLAQGSPLAGQAADVLFGRGKLPLQGGAVFFGVLQPIVDVLNAFLEFLDLGRGNILLGECRRYTQKKGERQ